MFHFTLGKTQGLSLVLNVDESELVAVPRENSGFKMLVHPPFDIPNIDDFGIELEPGTHTSIRVDVTEMSTLSAPYGDCGSKPLKYLNKNKYTESKCYLECELDYIVQQCGCRSFYMPGKIEMLQMIYETIIIVN